MSPQVRTAAAERVRQLADVSPWPDLEWFNTAPCEKHAPVRVNPVLCSRCGFTLRRHQRIGAAWLYLGMPALLSDTVGSGKTAQILAMLAMCKQTGELGPHNRAVIVCRAATVWDPWGQEIARLLPKVPAFIADGDRRERLAGYAAGWEIAVVSDRTFSPARGRKQERPGDVAVLETYPVGMLFYDDVDPMRNPDTMTALAVNRLAKRCSRVNGAHATPLQKRLAELWSFLEPLGGEKRLGSLQRVESRYIDLQTRWTEVADPRDRTGRTLIRKKMTIDNGITTDPKLVREFRAAIRPLVLRRTAGELDDATMPERAYNPVFLDLNPRQRAAYARLRDGVQRRLSSSSEVSRMQALAAFTRARQICSGLAAYEDGPDDSAKLDWTMDRITGDLDGEKVVVFVYFKPNLAALAQRLKAEGIDGVMIWSGQTDKKERARRLSRFREDRQCRVLMGTSAIEAGLNLQVARNLIAADTIPNPARMEQLAGRVRRQGSLHPTVYIHHLMTRNTVEEAFLPMLRREGEMSDVVWNERESMFAGLSPRQVMRLVASGRLEMATGR